MLHDIPNADSVDIGQEVAQRIKSILNLSKNENGYTTPYKDFLHPHMSRINELVIDAIAMPAGLKMENVEYTGIKHQLCTKILPEGKLSVVQWPKHLDFLRIMDETHRLWKFQWKEMLPTQGDRLIDSTQDVKALPRSDIAVTLTKMENHSMETGKTPTQRFRGITEYLIGASDRVLKPHKHEDLLRMDKNHIKKNGMKEYLRQMIQPWKGLQRGPVKRSYRGRSRSRGKSHCRSRSRSVSNKRAYRVASVSPMRNAPKYQTSLYSCTAPNCVDLMNTTNASAADMSIDPDANMNTSVADTTILSGMTAASNRTGELQSDKNVSFNVTGKAKIRNNT